MSAWVFTWDAAGAAGRSVRRRSVRRDRFDGDSWSNALGVGLPLRRLVGHQGPGAQGGAAISSRATPRKRTRLGQLAGRWMRMRAMCSMTRAPILIKRSRMVANSALARWLV